MQVCTSLQTDNHTSSPSCRSTNSVKALKADRSHTTGNQYKQVCVQLPTSAVNVELPALAVARAGRAAFDRYFLPAGPTAANPLHAAAPREQDRRMDGHRTVTQIPLCTPYGQC